MQLPDNGRAALRERVTEWATRLKVAPRIVRIQPMTRKWGSCSTTGIVSFAADLIERDGEFQDFVIAHELLHLSVPNHGRLFKARLTASVPGWRRMDLSR